MFILIDGVLPLEACLYYQVLPLYIEGSCLYLGMVTPDDTSANDYVRRIIHYHDYSLEPLPISSDTLQTVLTAYLNYSGQKQDGMHSDPTRHRSHRNVKARSEHKVDQNLQQTLVVDSPEELQTTGFSSADAQTRLPVSKIDEGAQEAEPASAIAPVAEELVSEPPASKPDEPLAMESPPVEVNAPRRNGKKPNGKNGKQSSVPPVAPPPDIALEATIPEMPLHRPGITDMPLVELLQQLTTTNEEIAASDLGSPEQDQSASEPSNLTVASEDLAATPFEVDPAAEFFAAVEDLLAGTGETTAAGEPAPSNGVGLQGGDRPTSTPPIPPIPSAAPTLRNPLPYLPPPQYPPLLNPLPALELQINYLSSPVEVLSKLDSKALLQELLGRILFGGIGRLYFERQAQMGRVLWSQNGVLQSVLEHLEANIFEGIIQELKGMTDLPQQRVTEPTQVEIERLYNQTRLLLRFRFMPGEYGEEATVQVLRGAALKFYQQQQLVKLERDALSIAKQLQTKLNEIRDRARNEPSLVGAKLEALPALSQLLKSIEQQLGALQLSEDEELSE